MMNSAAGETEVEIGGLRFGAVATLGAVAEAETAFGKPFGNLVADLTQGGHKAALCFLEASARAYAKRHGTDGPGDLSDVVVDMKALADAAVRVLEAAQLLGKPKDDKPGKAQARPASTGKG